MSKVLAFFLMGAIILLGLNYTGFVDWLGLEEDGDSVFPAPTKDFVSKNHALALKLKGHFACVPFPDFGKKKECHFLKVIKLWKALESNTPVLTKKPLLQNQFSLKGDLFSMESLKGQVLLLNFWASWCAPCREEFPELISAVKWSKGRLALLAVSNDSSLKDIREFLSDIKKAGLQWNQRDVYIIWDKEFELSGTFHVAKWPETFILDTHRRMVKKQAGVVSFPKIKPFLSRLLPP